LETRELETRASPMTLVTPLPRWRSWLLRFTWKTTRSWLALDAFVRRHSPLKLPRYPFGQLDKLAFIHFAHWSIVDRIPPSGDNARRLPHPYMFFQTNFNRGWREYVEAFCLIIPVAMRLNWRYMYGFPPPHPVGPFLDYVEERFDHHSHFYCAYPDSSTRMVLAAIEARVKFNTFAAEAIGPPASFLPRARRPEGPVLLGGGGWRGEKADTISVLSPVLPGYEDELREVLAHLPRDEKSPLADVTGTHMARFTVIKPLRHKRGKAIDTTSYLLFTAWFDGDTSEYVRALRRGMKDHGNQIWGKCAGYKGLEDLTAFGKFIDDHSIKPRLAFAGYSDRVTDVRASLQLRDALAPKVVEESGMDSVELERAWRQKRRMKSA
jgi:hypothetical protein